MDMDYTSSAYKSPSHMYRMGDDTICVLQYYDYGGNGYILDATIDHRIGLKHVRYHCAVDIGADVDMADLWRRESVCKLLACIIVETTSPYFAEDNGAEVEL